MRAQLFAPQAGGEWPSYEIGCGRPPQRRVNAELQTLKRLRSLIGRMPMPHASTPFVLFLGRWS
jgi:hypothetical protein